MRRCSAALVGILLAHSTLAAETLPPPGGKWIPVPQATIMARRHPDIGSCASLQADFDAAGWPRGTGIETIKQIDSRVRKGMVLRADRGSDTWTPLTAALIAGGRPTGDCDDMSISSAQLALCAGLPPDRVGLLITTSPNGRRGESHMLAFFKDAADRTWVFGDTFARPRAIARVREKLLFMAYLTDVTRWYGLLGRTEPRSLAPSATSSIPLIPDASQTLASCTNDVTRPGD